MERTLCVLILAWITTVQGAVDPVQVHQVSGRTVPKKWKTVPISRLVERYDPRHAMADWSKEKKFKFTFRKLYGLADRDDALDLEQRAEKPVADSQETFMNLFGRAPTEIEKDLLREIRRQRSVMKARDAGTTLVPTNKAGFLVLFAAVIVALVMSGVILGVVMAIWNRKPSSSPGGEHPPALEKKSRRRLSKPIHQTLLNDVSSSRGSGGADSSVASTSKEDSTVSAVHVYQRSKPTATKKSTPFSDPAAAANLPTKLSSRHLRMFYAATPYTSSQEESRLWRSESKGGSNPSIF